MAEPGGTRALENSGNYTTERGGNDRAEMGWKLTTEPGWIKNGIRTEKTGRKCSQRDYPHEQLWARRGEELARARCVCLLKLDLVSCQAVSDARGRHRGRGLRLIQHSSM